MLFENDLETKRSCIKTCKKCCEGPPGPQGPKGDQGPEGPQGIQGPQGEQGPILQQFVNSNIQNTQIIESGSNVLFPPITSTAITINGIQYNGTDTFTVITPGIYVLECVLNLSPDNVSGTSFAVNINGTNVAPASNSGNVGPIILTRVQYYTAGTLVKIVNQSGHAVTITNSPVSLSDTGHFSFYKIADGGVELTDPNVTN